MLMRNVTLGLLVSCLVAAGLWVRPVSATATAAAGAAELVGRTGAKAAASAAPAACTPLPSGLTHWWPGESGLGDVIGGDAGAIVGTVSHVPGFIGQAFQFGSGHIRLSQTYGGSSTTEVTAMAWIQTQQTGPDPWQAILSSNTGSFLHFQTAAFGGSALYSDPGSAGFSQIPSFGPAPTGVWRHVALTAKSGDIRVYENGAVVGQTTMPFGYITQATDAVLIGAGYLNARPFPGLIDELQVYNRALSQSEVQAAFTAGSAGFCEPQIADGDVAGLIAAIVAANSRPGPDSIALADNGAYTLTASYDATNGLPMITDALTINGHGATITRSSAPGTPEFRIASVSTPQQSDVVTLSHVTISNGRHSGSFPGGGIRLDRGTLSVNDSQISGNTASAGGGLWAAGQTILNVARSTITGNVADDSSAVGEGGGLYSAGTLTVTNSTVSGNTARLKGGGIFAFTGGTLTVLMSTISGNSAHSAAAPTGGYGGGIFNWTSSSAVVANSTIAGNFTNFAGGGLYNNGTLTATNVTIAGNTSTQYASGLANDSSGSTSLQNTLLAANTGAKNCRTFGAPILSLGHNLSDDATCASFLLAAGDLNATPAGLDPGGLMDNGGPTRTVALAPGSTAIDAGDDATCAAAPVRNLDQRGSARPVAVHCDIGALEVSATPDDGSGHWRSQNAMPTARLGLAATNLNGRLYAIGGATSPNNFPGVGVFGVTAVEAYDPTTNTWTSAAPLPAARVYPNGAAAINGRIYLPGGSGCDAPGCRESDTLFIFDSMAGPNGAWSAGTPMPALVQGGSSGAIDNKLYVLAGWSVGAPRNYFFRFDPGTATWTQLVGSPRLHVFGASAVVGGKFYATGGEGNMQALDVYDPATGLWTSRTMPLGYQHHAAMAVGDWLILAGGSQFVSGTYVSDRTVVAYDTLTDTWTTPNPVASAGESYSASVGAAVLFSGRSTSTFAPLPGGLDIPAGAGLASSAYVAGGWDATHARALNTLYGMNPIRRDTLTYAWDFGDGAQGTGPDPSHAYAAPGTYSATLTVSTPDGRSGSATATVTVAAAPPPSTLTTYTYLGNPLGNCSGTYTGCGPETRVNGWMTLPQPLGPNLLNEVVTPGAFRFTDGRSATLGSSDALAVRYFQVSTDAAGQIMRWTVNLATISTNGCINDNVLIGTYYVPFSNDSGDFSCYLVNQNLPAQSWGGAQSHGTPGSWIGPPTPNGVQAWIKASDTGPSPRAGHRVVYDSTRHKVILFGGQTSQGCCGGGQDLTGQLLNDMWEWDGVTRTWTSITPASGPVPAPRSFFGMAYDPTRDRVVIYGGKTGSVYYSTDSDTWEWNPSTRSWASFPAANPLDYGGRRGVQLAYDPNLGQVILFGGVVYWGEFFGNTFAWTGGTWTQLPAIGPAGRQGHVMATDWSRSRVMLYGGSSSAGAFNDTWEWDGSGWTPLAASSIPQRSFSAVAYDASRDVNVLFGGSRDSNPPSFRDTWARTVAGWTLSNVLASPPPLESAMAFDGTNIMLFGGRGPSGPTGETWLLVSGGVATLPQSITFTSTPPDPAVVGGTYTVSATGGGSGNAVTFSSLTPLVCSVSSSLVSLTGVGTCTIAADQAGSGEYLPAPRVTLTLQVTSRPSVSVPGIVIVEAAGPAGSVVTFAATASDPFDASPSVSCLPAAGTIFGLGSTNVTCTATNSFGNTAAGTFSVVVRDTVAPTIALVEPNLDGVSVIHSSTVFLRLQVTDAVGVAAVSINGTSFTRVSGSALAGLWDGTVAVTPLAAATFTTSAVDLFQNSNSSTFIADGDGIVAGVDRQRSDVHVDQSTVYSSDFNDGTTFGTIYRSEMVVEVFPRTQGGQQWIGVTPLPWSNPAGTLTVTACAGSLKGVTLKLGDSASVRCTNAGTSISVNAVRTTTTIPVRKYYAACSGGSCRQYVSVYQLAAGGTVTTGSPATADPDNTVPIPVELRKINDDGSEAVIATFDLDPGETVDVELVAGQTATDDRLQLTVLSGHITATIGGDTVTVSQGGTVTARVDQLAQAIAFAPLPNTLFGDAAFALAASATSGLPVTYVASGSCAVSGVTLTPTGTGACSVTASQSGDLAYLPAPPVTRTFSIWHAWSGLLQPVNSDGTSVFKLGSTIPLKFQLTGGSANVTSLGARVYIAKVSNAIVGSEVEAATTGTADSGNTFRYDAQMRQYVFNWGTKGLSDGTWQIRVDLLDGNASRVVLVSLKK